MLKGKVYLVGAGPGDKELITVKGINCIKEADVIVYDQLANPILLEDRKEKCELVFVGKKAGNHTLPQEEINLLLVKYAKKGKVVVRLKGGDPYVFGRGGEEGEVLFNNNIKFEVIPGISSAIGGLAYAGIPITHREKASSLHIITGHLKSQEKDLDWEVLAKIKGTLVFLMGVGSLKRICEKLVVNGKDIKTKAAIVYRATTPYQKTVTGNLGNIYELATRENIKPPSIIVIGDVIDKRNYLNFFEEKPLFGKKVIVTRSREKSSKLVSRIEKLGGLAIECPTIKINSINEEELKKKIKILDKFNHIIFTSQKSVEIFFKALYNQNIDARALWKIKFTVIGAETKKELLKYGIVADYQPSSYCSEEVVALLKDKLSKEDYVFIPRAKKGNRYLVEELSKYCKVDELFIYDTKMDDIDDGTSNNITQALETEKIDYITFTSSSTVDNFISLIGKENIDVLKRVKIISIGPKTSDTVKSYGLNLYKEAEEYNIDGIMKILERG